MKKEKFVAAEFATLIKQERMKKGYSLEVVAKNIGFSPSYVSRIENYERRNPSTRVFYELAELLEIDFLEMLQTAYPSASTKS